LHTGIDGSLRVSLVERLLVDVVQMNLPPGSWQEEGNHKGRWHFNYVLSGTGVFNIHGQE